jgi:aspartyl-tRNA(Asn)/glutamyl-tRNA(Gln) amidotransferase subunit A
MSNLSDLSVRQALKLLQNGDISSVELTQSYLDRIQTVEPQIKAFITLTPELAIAQAKSADQLRKNNPPEDLPALLGLPIAVKDVLALQNVRCTCGSRILENFIPPYTATTVQRLLDAGVGIIWKTKNEEIRMGAETYQ